MSYYYDKSTNFDEHFIPISGLDLEEYIKVDDICGIHHLIPCLLAFDIFEWLNKNSKSGYVLKLNPVLCRNPIVMTNPFK